VGVERGRHRLTFQLRHGVKWHDGQPFTPKDVVCTYICGWKGARELRVNPGLRPSKNSTISRPTGVRGDLHLNRPQPAFLMLISGAPGDLSLPCLAREDAPPAIGTGPFKFVDYKANQFIQGGAQPELLKPGRPYSRRHEYPS